MDDIDDDTLEGELVVVSVNYHLVLHMQEYMCAVLFVAMYTYSFMAINLEIPDFVMDR